MDLRRKKVVIRTSLEASVSFKFQVNGVLGGRKRSYKDSYKGERE